MCSLTARLLPLVLLASVACSSESDDSGGDDGQNVPAGGSTGSGSGGGSAFGGSAAGGADPNDPYAEARQLCVDTINQFRAEKGLVPLSRWTEAESCTDQQATSDETTGSAHGAFGDCDERAQNECLGGGVDRLGRCLQSMWGEKDQPGCAGCDACAAEYTSDCPNCDFYGEETGEQCGHYVNMSAEYLTQVACGFSSLGGWAVINFR